MLILLFYLKYMKNIYVCIYIDVMKIIFFEDILIFKNFEGSGCLRL